MFLLHDRCQICSVPRPLVLYSIIGLTFDLTGHEPIESICRCCLTDIANQAPVDAPVIPHQIGRDGLYRPIHPADIRFEYEPEAFKYN